MNIPTKRLTKLELTDVQVRSLTDLLCHSSVMTKQSVLGPILTELAECSVFTDPLNENPPRPQNPPTPRTQSSLRVSGAELRDFSAEESTALHHLLYNLSIVKAEVQGTIPHLFVPAAKLANVLQDLEGGSS